MRFLFLFLFFILAYPSCFAAATPSTQKIIISDWSTLLKALDAEGIDTYSLDWTEVDSGCSFYREKGDEAYNDCRLKKARDQDDYANNNKTCSIRANNTYPDSLLKPETEKRIIKEKDGEKKETKLIREAISQEKLNSLRRKDFYQCMIDFGWSNPDNWKSGRRLTTE